MSDSLSFFQWPTPFQSAPQCDDTLAFCLDSVLTCHEVPDSLVHESLFRQHLLPAHHATDLLREAPMAEPWVFVALLMLFFLVCFIFKRFGLDIPKLFALAFDSRQMNHMLRDNNLNHKESLATIGWIIASTAALLAFFVCRYFHVRPFALADPLLFALLWGTCVALFFARNGLERLLGMIFECDEASLIYINSNYAFHLIECTIMIPLVFFLFYSPLATHWVLAVCVWTLALLLLVRVFRGLQLILTFIKGGRLYIFYYLCTLEMVPVILLIKASISL